MEIISAVDMLNQSTRTEEYKKEIDSLTYYQMNRIKTACERGVTSCVFEVGYTYIEDMKSLFKAQGYWFKPMERCDGIGEWICWGAR
jgi:hypothetical protein